MPLNPVPNYPVSLDSFPDPTDATYEDDDGFEIDYLLQKHNAAIEILEAKVGVTSSVPAADTALEGTGTGASAWAKRASVRAYNNANISIATATVTALTFDSERHDTDTMHSTSVNTGRLTATTAGKYLIWANVVIAANAAGLRIVSLRVNGSTIIGSVRALGSASTDAYVNLATVYSLAANDYVEVTVYQDTGGALNVLASAAVSPEAGMTRVA